jgi:hypothetical protein
LKNSANPVFPLVLNFVTKKIVNGPEVKVGTFKHVPIDDENEIAFKLFWKFDARLGAFVVRFGPGESACRAFPDLSFHFVTFDPERVMVVASAASYQSDIPVNPALDGVRDAVPERRENDRVPRVDIEFPHMSTFVIAE